MRWSNHSTDIATSTGVQPSFVSRMWLNTSAEGQFDLLINSTQQTDADTYWCFEAYWDTAQADLTVIGK